MAAEPQWHWQGPPGRGRRCGPARASLSGSRLRLSGHRDWLGSEAAAAATSLPRSLTVSSDSVRRAESVPSHGPSPSRAWPCRVRSGDHCGFQNIESDSNPGWLWPRAPATGPAELELLLGNAGPNPIRPGTAMTRLMGRFLLVCVCLSLLCNYHSVNAFTASLSAHKACLPSNSRTSVRVNSKKLTPFQKTVPLFLRMSEEGIQS